MPLPLWFQVKCQTEELMKASLALGNGSKHSRTVGVLRRLRVFTVSGRGNTTNTKMIQDVNFEWTHVLRFYDEFMYLVNIIHMDKWRWMGSFRESVPSLAILAKPLQVEYLPNSSFTPLTLWWIPSGEGTNLRPVLPFEQLNSQSNLIQLNS